MATVPASYSVNVAPPVRVAPVVAPVSAEPPEGMAPEPDSSEAVRTMLRCRSMRHVPPMRRYGTPLTEHFSPSCMVPPAVTHDEYAVSRAVVVVKRGIVLSDRSMTAFWMSWLTFGTAVEDG